MDYPPLPQRLLAALDRYPSPRTQMFRLPSGWQEISSAEFLRRIAGFSRALHELGVKAGDRVGVFAPNCPEWHVADFAVTGLGAVVVPIYFRESIERMGYILKDSGAKAVFVAGADQAHAVALLRPNLSELQHIIVAKTALRADPHAAGAIVLAEGEALDYETLIAGAGASEVESYRGRAAQVRSEQLATLIYTSGTTGEPKGVMLSHRNLSSNATDAVTPDFRPADIGLSFLPLSHVYERQLAYMYFFTGMTVAYVERMEDVQQALLEVRPHLVAAVPRFFEKIFAGLMQRGRKFTGLKRWLFDWGMLVAAEAAPWKSSVRPASLGLRLKWAVADRLIYSKIRAAMGGRIRSFIAGGGPLSKELAEFFWGVDIRVYQGYGLTETSPIVCTNTPAQNRMGTSGKLIPNVEVRIAEDGEIEVRGPCVMMGYYNKPEATREALGPDGWLRTGDIGVLDKDGYLSITDRKKDLIKTAGGKFVAPQPIENLLKSCPYILNAVVVGDRRKFVSALIVPNLAAVETAAREAGVKFTSPHEVLTHPWTRELIDHEVTRLTHDLAQYEKIKRFALLDKDFTFDDGQLTYTLKLRRRVIEERYRDAIEQLYADVAQPRPAQAGQIS
jgi:long-chain acyl-CoA synthetase